MKIYLSKEEKPYQAQIKELVDKIITINPNFNGYDYEILDSDNGEFYVDSDGDLGNQGDYIFNSILGLIDSIKHS